MDIRNLFGSTFSKSATSRLREFSSDSDTGEDSISESLPSKRSCVVPSSADISRKYNKNWEKDFPWLEYDSNFQGAFCKIYRKAGTRGHSSQGSEVCGSQSHYRIGKRQFKR